jgi:hypothetical protein
VSVDVKALRESVLLDEAAAVAAEARAKKSRALLQFHCSHESLLRAEHYAGFLATLPSFQVCTVCGFAETDWSCGPQIFGRSSGPYIDRDEAMKHVHGRVHDNSQFVGYYLDVAAAGGREAFKRGVLLQVLGLTEDDLLDAVTS